MSTIDRELNAEATNTSADAAADEPTDLATLDEDQRNLVQMQQVAEATVEPGLFRLPVKRAATAEENRAWSIDVEHPVEGEIRFRIDKPTTEGWVDDQELVQLLRWYQIHDRDPYKLQTRFVYVEHKGDESDTPHGWELVQPPDYTKPEKPVPEQLADYWHAAKTWRPPRNVAVAYTFLFAGALIGAMAAAPLASVAGLIPVLGGGVVWHALVTAVMFIATTIIALVVTEP